MPDIFLSYSREDQARAKLFAEAVHTQGWDVGLRTAKAVVVLWSNKLAQSRWVLAQARLADSNKTLVPCMVEPCERPIMFELTQTEHLIDAWNATPLETGA